MHMPKKSYELTTIFIRLCRTCLELLVNKLKLKIIPKTHFEISFAQCFFFHISFKRNIIFFQLYTYLL